MNYCLDFIFFFISVSISFFHASCLPGHPDSSTTTTPLPHHPTPLYSFQTDVISRDFLFGTHGSGLRLKAICSSPLQGTKASQLWGRLLGLSQHWGSLRNKSTMTKTEELSCYISNTSKYHAVLNQFSQAPVIWEDISFWRLSNHVQEDCERRELWFWFTSTFTSSK